MLCCVLYTMILHIQNHENWNSSRCNLFIITTIISNWQKKQKKQKAHNRSRHIHLTKCDYIFFLYSFVIINKFMQRKRETELIKHLYIEDITKLNIAKKELEQLLAFHDESNNEIIKQKEKVIIVCKIIYQNTKVA